MSRKSGIHWQLLWFSCLAFIHGGAYALVFAQPNRRLPAGLAELPTWVLFTLAAGWLAAGGYGWTTALIIRGGHSLARSFIGIMCGCWFGAYTFGWLSGGNHTGWIAAGLYGFLGLAVVTPPPPVWTVMIKSKAGV